MSPQDIARLTAILNDIEDEVHDQAELVTPGSPLDHRVAGKQDVIKVIRAKMKLWR